jgi:cobalt-zinc-cadmium efflux system protein
VLKQVTDLLRERFNVYFSTIQVEEYCLDLEESAAEIDITRPQSETGRIMQQDHVRQRGDHGGH